MPYAWISPPNVVRDVCLGEGGIPGIPAEQYTPDIAVLYDTLVPDGIVNGATFENGAWVNPPVPIVPILEFEPIVIPEKVTLFQIRAALLLTDSPTPGSTWLDLFDAKCVEIGGLTLEAWNTIDTVQRAAPFFNDVADAIQMDEPTKDQIFMTAGSIDLTNYNTPKAKK